MTIHLGLQECSAISEIFLSPLYQGTHAAAISMDQHDMEIGTSRQWARDREKDIQVDKEATETTIVRFNRPFLLYVMDCKNETEIMVARVFNPTDE